jgi:hypothetical protein
MASHLILNKGAKNIIGEKTISSTNGAGKLDVHMKKTETRSLSLTLFKNQFKMDQRFYSMI